MNKNIAKGLLTEYTEEDLRYMPNITFLYYNFLSIYSEGVPFNRKLIDAALEEDEQTTLKLILFLRDKYFGLGRREDFRKIIRYVATHKNTDLTNVINLIDQYGRWDDLYSLFDTKWERCVLRVFKKQLKDDIELTKPSSLCKWLKSENASSEKTKYLAKKTAEGLNMTYKEYRTLLSLLRGRYNVLERKISAKEYSDVKYGDLTRSNLNKYKKAFIKNDKERYLKFIKFHNNYRNNSNGLSSYLKFKNQKNESDEITKILDYIDNNESTGISNIIDEIGVYNCESLSVFLNNKACKNREEIASLLATICLGKNNKYNLKNNFYYGSKRIKLKNEHPEEYIELFKENNYDETMKETIDLESILDELLLIALRNKYSKHAIPKQLIVFTPDAKMLKIRGSNICSEGGEIPLIIKDIKSKWDKTNYKLPKITVFNVCKTYRNYKTFISGINIINTNEKDLLRKVFKKENIFTTNNYYELLDILNCTRYKKIDVV